MLNLDETYICPYCATTNKLRDYKLKYKDNNLKWATCPVCNNTMKRNTLMNPLNSFEWGEWIYLSIRQYRGVAVNKSTYSFYDKVKFDLLIKNLDAMPLYYKKGFWNGYKFAKDNYPKSREILPTLEAKINSGNKDAKPSKIDNYI